MGGRLSLCQFIDVYPLLFLADLFLFLADLFVFFGRHCCILGRHCCIFCRLCCIFWLTLLYFLADLVVFFGRPCCIFGRPFVLFVHLMLTHVTQMFMFVWLVQLVEVKRVGEGAVSSKLLPIFVKHHNHSFMFSPVIISHIIQLSTTLVFS